MILNEPLEFKPLYMQRIWGGRHLESLYQKSLPPGVCIGESWEIVDREDAQSIVENTHLKGTSLHELWRDYRKEIFGTRVPESKRFPLLIKLLDAQETLSLQVHPPEEIAPLLLAEPKTEMWYFLECTANAHIFAGLKNGFTRTQFESLLKDGHAKEVLHQITVKKGDCIFIPSGRLHAIGAGCILAEVQQNSDTTYRVFDWNRMGIDGKPRELHIEQAMQSIDFNDFEPSLISSKNSLLVSCPEFRVELLTLTQAKKSSRNDSFSIYLCVEGQVQILGKVYHPGEIFLVPATLANAEISSAQYTAKVLHIQLPLIST